MTWNVFTFDFNTKKLNIYNVLSHTLFVESVEKRAKELYGDNLPDYTKFKEYVRLELQYYFWSKCEYEVILSAWPPNNNIEEEKIDVYDQVMLNFEQFYRYLYYNLFGDKEEV